MSITEKMLSSADSRKTAILLVDIQSAFLVPDYFGSGRNNPQLEENVQRLVESARNWNKDKSRGGDDFVEVVHVHHHTTSLKSPLHPTFIVPNSQEIHGTDPLPCAAVAEGEAVFIKHVNSGFIGTSLEQHLREKRIRQLLIFGLITNHCVSTTTRMAKDLKVVDDLETGEKGTLCLIEDACATFGNGKHSAELIHDVHVESLRGEFAEIVATNEVAQKIFEKEK